MYFQNKYTIRMQYDALNIYVAMLAKTKIHVLVDYNECDEIFCDLNERAPKVAGFDTEWWTTDEGMNKVSLVQISVCENTYLIRINSMFFGRDYKTHNLVVFLENPLIYKVGVEVWTDKTMLYNDFGIKTCGTIDLNGMYNLVTNRKNEYMSLKSFTKMCCGHDLPKDKEIRCGNWENLHLSSDQILYAAGDSFYALEIFEVLRKNSDTDINIIVDSKVMKRRLACVEREKEKEREIQGEIQGQIQYLKTSDEICVKCGCEEKLESFWIVPNGIRRALFPRLFKDSTYDKIILCPKCRNYAKHLYNEFTCKMGEHYKKNASKEYNEQIELKIKEYNDNQNEKIKIRKKCRTIERSLKILITLLEHELGLQISKFKNATYIEKILKKSSQERKYYEKIIMDYVCSNNTIQFLNILNIENLEKLHNHIIDKIKANNAATRSHTVHKYYQIMWYYGYIREQKDERLCLFAAVNNYEKVWRNYFIENVKPKYMPANWSIEYACIDLHGRCNHA